MTRAELHLVDTAGRPVRPSVQAAVEDAFRWAIRNCPLVDAALIANWSEEVACSMETIAAELRNPARYAAAALNGKVRDWQRTGAAKLETMGMGCDLERVGGTSERIQGALDRKVFFEQIKATLNDRDQVILLLLLDGSSDTEVASALAVTSSTGRKAIQRVKERIAATLKVSRVKNDPEHGTRTLCPTKG